MKIAIVGSRTLKIDNLEDYLIEQPSEIVSGGAVGIDDCAKAYAVSKGIPYTEFLPKYEMYGRAAPIRRNDQIVQYADLVIAFWDGRSVGTKYVIEACRRFHKPLIVNRLVADKDER